MSSSYYGRFVRRCWLIFQHYRPSCYTECHLVRGGWPPCRTGHSIVGHGHFFKTQPNPKFLDPTQPTKVFTQPNPTHYRHLVRHIGLYRKLYTTTVTRYRQDRQTFYMPTVNESYYSAADSRVFHDVKNFTQSSLHPTQPTKIKKNSDPTQLNPIHGWTQPMAAIALVKTRCRPFQQTLTAVSSIRSYVFFFDVQSQQPWSYLHIADWHDGHRRPIRFIVANTQSEHSVHGQRHLWYCLLAVRFIVNIRLLTVLSTCILLL